jgi:hypothetical protein
LKWGGTLAARINGSFQPAEAEPTRRTYAMKAEQLDDILDSGADLLSHLDLSTVRRPNLEQKRVNVDLPIWMIRT